MSYHLLQVLSKSELVLQTSDALSFEELVSFSLFALSLAELFNSELLTGYNLISMDGCSVVSFSHHFEIVYSNMICTSFGVGDRFWPACRKAMWFGSE